MFKNIGRSVRILAIVLAALSFALFAAFGVLCLLAALADGVDEVLKTAGLQAAIISFALALLTPFLQLITYGLGALIDTARENVQEQKRVRDLLQAALAEGRLSDEIARKSAMAMTKVLPKLQMQAPAAPTGAPVQRPVAQPAAPVVTEEPPAEEEPVPVEDEVAVEKIEEVPAEAQAPAPKPVPKPVPKPAPVKPKPAKPLPQNGTWRTLTDDEETF